jgi:membrane-bound lytic murein transglycosylase B
MKILLLAVLGDLAVDTLKLGAALVVGIIILTLITLATLLALPLGLIVGVGVPPGDAPPLALGNPGEIPSEQLTLMRQVAAATGVPWQVLAAIAKIESDFGRNMATSPAGAIGYGQFQPSTWAAYGNGGDPYDFHDAIPAMGRYLQAAGAPAHLRQAIWAYNHANWYVDLVLTQARAYGYSASGN